MSLSFKKILFFISLFFIFFVLLTSKIDIVGNPSAQSDVNLYFSPSEVFIPPSQTISLMGDFDSYKAGYVKIQLLFDKTKIHMIDEIVTTHFLGNIINLTSKEEANQTGVVYVTLGLTQDQLSNPPSGVVEIARLKFGLSSSIPINSQTTLQIGNDVQIVTIDTSELSYTKNDLKFNLNFSITLAPSCQQKEGDANGDCNVDGLDYAIWFLNFDKSVGGGRTEGDFNLSGRVDGVDYALWFLNIGN